MTIDDATVKAAFERYMAMRHELGRDAKPVCLMDMGTIGAKWLKKNGQLTGLDESEEINACTVKVKVDVNGQDEDWLFLFKNETHNHPTEIEPFGGAATCIGGCIRDPLSGRSYVYQAMRVTGAADPTVPVRDAGRQAPAAQARDHRRRRATLLRQPDRSGHRSGRRDLPPRLRGQAHGGRCGRGRHPGRPCAPRNPAPGDMIILLGGRTGRDGIGGATGSSKAHNVESLEPTAPRCRRATLRWSASCSVCSAAAMPAA